jgi:ABC-type multidrug transport system fused ATPase/permease subunit
MMRLYEPLSGNVLLDGVDLTKLDIAWLRSVIALVGQEPILFSWTLKDNLLYGKPDATDKEIEHAIQESGAAEIIQKLPDGLETKMAAGTTNLSVGQRQRLIIARAFLRNAPLLLLDEPTSALDVRSEELVTEAIGRLRQGRTCVMITHRISTARDADFIAGAWRLAMMQPAASRFDVNLIPCLQ